LLAVEADSDAITIQCSRGCHQRSAQREADVAAVQAVAGVGRQRAVILQVGPP